MSLEGHRHTTGHEHEFEPQRGLPEPLPATERVLWQGSPDWRLLAVRAFHVRKLAAYFAALLALRGAFVISDGGTAGAALQAVLVALPLPLLALGALALMAWLSARGAVYTVTNRRVVMRIGIVLTVTFNLPLARIAGAGLRLHGPRGGDIPLALAGSDRIAWLHLWPHVRPWKLVRPEPMLRCVPDAERVARILTDAWSATTGGAAAPVPRPVRTAPPGVLATR